MAYIIPDPDSGSPTSVDQIIEPTITKVSDTSISVRINTSGMSGVGSITSYKVFYRQMVDFVTPSGSEQTASSASNPVVITGLTKNSLYLIRTQVTTASETGSGWITYFYLSSVSQDPVPILGTPVDVNDPSNQKSYLKLTGGDKVDNKYTIAYRQFNSVELPSSTTVNGAPSYTKKYYAFGTRFLMPPLIYGYEAQGAGLGFFVDADSGNGYFLTVDTSGTAATLNSRPVKVFKLTSKNIKLLEDSQKGNTDALDAVFAGRTYDVNIRVKLEGQSIEIVAYINGFKITATDTVTFKDSFSGSVPKNILSQPTKYIGLVASSGTSLFDYAYAKTITEAEYNDFSIVGFYDGQYADEILDSSFGQIDYIADNNGSAAIDSSIDEFGTTVREMVKRTVKLPSRPSIPVSWTLGANNLAKIVAQKCDNFGGEAYILNNSSITVPLADDNANSLSILGADIGFSGDIEYLTNPSSEGMSKDPAVFESKWLHSESDVKALAEWIRGRSENKDTVIEMDVFGNPLISVGDIVAINYAYQKLTTSQKFIVLKVSNSYKEGISTKITVRTL